MKKMHYGWLVMLNGALVVLGALGLARFGYTLVLPSMQAGLGMENTQAGALATANLIGYLVLSLLGGALAVRFGPRLVITAGLLVAAVMVFTGLAGSFAGVVVWRALTGIGSGASNLPVMGLLAAWFGKHLGFSLAGGAVPRPGTGLVSGPLSLRTGFCILPHHALQHGGRFP